jgi:hypothetical protein
MSQSAKPIAHSLWLTEKFVSFCPSGLEIREQRSEVSGQCRYPLFVTRYTLYAKYQPFTLSTSVNLSTGQIVKTITIKIVKVLEIVQIVENYKTADRDKFPE